MNETELNQLKELLVRFYKNDCLSVCENCIFYGKVLEIGKYKNMCNLLHSIGEELE